MNALAIAAIGLQHDQERLRIIGHNVANITTPGYRRQVMVTGAFGDVLDSAAVSSTVAVLTPGKVQSTGNPLDVALEERDFIVVQTPVGEQALSRGGALKIDANGQLVNRQGLPVQGRSGFLAAPATANQVRLSTDGQMTADGTLVGSLRVVRLQSGFSVEPLGEGLYRMPAGAGALTELQAPVIRTGQLELSNTQGSTEMLAMMATMRHAEAMSRLIQGGDDLLEKAIRRLGESA